MHSKVAVYCFYTLFKRKLVSPEVLRGLYAQLAAPIKTCLGDEDSVTRKWSCLLMQYAYVLLAGKCTHDEVSDIYHDLVKRLDDSNNEVRRRLHGCGGFGVVHLRCGLANYVRVTWVVAAGSQARL